MNYQKLLDDELQKINERKTRPKLLLHVCCGPCSSYVLEYLCQYFDITIFYYNPNISPKEEYDKRVLEVKRLIKDAPFIKNVTFINWKYDNEAFKIISKGLEQEKEGGKRCKKCYNLRLEETALYAKENNFDYFTTTLSISPYKDANTLNCIGKRLSIKYDVPYLFSDFKKKNGYKRSIELSKQFNLYRQDFCGCVFSKMESEERRKITVND